MSNEEFESNWHLLRPAFWVEVWKGSGGSPRLIALAFIAASAVKVGEAADRIDQWAERQRDELTRKDGSSP